MTRLTRRTPGQWQALVDQWRGSGQSATRFCNVHGIGYASFCNWRKRFADEQELPVEREASFIDISAPLEPAATREALDYIAALYHIEEQIRDEHLSGDKKRQHRLEYSKPVVDCFFEWCDQQLRRGDLTPKNPLSKALGSRVRQLRL